MKLCDLIELDVPSKAFNYVLTISRIVIALREGTACISQIVISTHTPNHYFWLGLEYDSVLIYYQICLHLHPTLHLCRVCAHLTIEQHKYLFNTYCCSAGNCKTMASNLSVATFQEVGLCLLTKFGPKQLEPHFVLGVAHTVRTC